MTDRDKLSRELAAIRSVVRVVSAIAWGVAVVVMVYGIPIVYQYLVHTGVPKETAWLLSLAVDLALAVGLVATPILAQHGVKSGWVGTLRWVAGFATWALNTAESWMADGGPKLNGVVSHTWGPVMMFFAVEAAAYFQRKMHAVIAEKQVALAEAEATHRAEAKERADMAARIRALTAELADARRQIAQTDTTTAAVRAEAEAEVERIRVEAEAEVGILRQRAEAAEATADRLRVAAEVAASDHRAALAKVRSEAAEAVARAQAEAGIPHLSDRRSGGTTGGTRKTSGGKAKTTTSIAAGGAGRASISDEDAVQKCIAEHSEPNYPWTKQEIVNIVGCGWGRAPRLLEAIAEYHAGGASVATGGSTTTASATAAEVTTDTTGGDTTAASDPTTEDTSAGPVAATG